MPYKSWDIKWNWENHRLFSCGIISSWTYDWENHEISKGLSAGSNEAGRSSTNGGFSLGKSGIATVDSRRVVVLLMLHQVFLMCFYFFWTLWKLVYDGLWLLLDRYFLWGTGKNVLNVESFPLGAWPGIVSKSPKSGGWFIMSRTLAAVSFAAPI